MGGPASAEPAVSAETRAALQAITEAMRSPNKAVRLKAVGQLVHFSGGEDAKVEVLPALRRAMHDAEPEVRAVACTATGNMEARAADAVPELAGLLHDRDPEVRQCAVRALGRIGEPARA